MRHLSTRLLTAAAVVPITLFASAAPVQAQQPFAEPSEAAASWLVSQSDGTAWNGQDVAVSLDSLIGLMAARVGSDQVQTTLEWLNDPDVLNSYVYPASDESAEPTLAAGSAGKVMYVVATAGGDPNNFGGVKLADAVTATQAETGGYGDGTPITNAWAILGLSRTDAPAGEEAAAAVAASQCEDGGFNFIDVDGGSDCASDPDTTGLVASALATMSGETASSSLDAAIGWLESNQAESGGFDNGFGENANSTAMAAQAFLAAERAEAAERAVAFLIGLQLGCGDDAAGAFKYIADETGDEASVATGRLYATVQAMVPVAGQNLAELDASDSAAGVPGNGCETADAGDATTAGEDAESGSAAWLPWAIGAAAVVLAALIIGFVLRARRGGESGEGQPGE